MMNTRILPSAALLGAAAVALGAFGSHGLKPYMTDYQISIFEKGIQYHFVHTLALLATGILMNQSNRTWLRRSSYLFILGILLFSGSLYLLACRDLLPFSVSWVGPLTPIGGLCFIAGWLSLAWGLQR